MRFQPKFTLPHNLPKPAANSSNPALHLKQKLNDVSNFKAIRPGMMGTSSVIADDCMSVTSDTTIIQQGYSQEDINSFRMHLADTLKLLVTTAEENTEKLVNALSVRHSEKTNVVIHQISEIRNEMKNSHSNFSEMQSSLAMEMSEELIQLKERVQEENDKMMDALGIAMKAVQIVGAREKKVVKIVGAKKRKAVHGKPKMNSECFGPVAKKRATIPCECLMRSGNFRTRKQVMDAYKEGKLECVCKKEKKQK
jgi:hypothetical protein